MSLLQAVFTSQIYDLECLASYLGLQDDFTGRLMQRMTGLTSSQLSELRSGKIRQTRNADHSRVLGDLARALSERSQGATGAGGPSGSTWLTSGTLVRTSKGRLRPIEVFSDPALALEALDELRHTLEG